MDSLELSKNLLTLREAGRSPSSLGRQASARLDQLALILVHAEAVGVPLSDEALHLIGDLEVRLDDLLDRLEDGGVRLPSLLASGPLSFQATDQFVDHFLEDLK